MVIDRYRVAAILGPLLLMLPWIAHIFFNIHDSTVVSVVSCLVMLSAATLLVLLYRLAQVACKIQPFPRGIPKFPWVRPK